MLTLDEVTQLFCGAVGCLATSGLASPDDIREAIRRLELIADGLLAAVPLLESEAVPALHRAMPSVMEMPSVIAAKKALEQAAHRCERCGAAALTPGVIVPGGTWCRRCWEKERE